MASISKNNIVCAYRLNDQDSYAYALQYKALHELDDEQLVPLPCTNTHILANYSDFLDQVENPLYDAINQDLVNRTIYAVVLMPFVPGGFYDGTDIISSTSRISRLYQTLNKNVNNIYFNRQIFKRFDEIDAQNYLICTRIDGVNLTVDRWFNNLQNFKYSLAVEGNFYIDAYSAYTYAGAKDYESEIVAFGNDFAPKLNLAIQKTAIYNNVADPVFPSIRNDSIFWGYGADRGARGFFKSSPFSRVFFYNADFDGALDIRNPSSRSWPAVALSQGYMATAGCLSASNTSVFLRPRPFFDCMSRGATLGEAFLFSQPLLDSSMVCFGDPLQIFQFREPVVDDGLLPIVESWQNMQENFAKTAALLFRKAQIAETLRNYVALGTDEKVITDLMYKFDAIYVSYNDTRWKYDLQPLFNYFSKYATQLNQKRQVVLYDNLDTFLQNAQLEIRKIPPKISDVLLQTKLDDAFIQGINPASIYPIGSWVFEADLEHYFGEYRFYNFDLEVARTLDDFDNNKQIIIKDSLTNNANWFYEEGDNTFKPFVGTGLTSAYEGKKVRYVSSASEYLERGLFYWFRFRQKDELETFDWRYFEILIYR